ncbi:MAG: hypothetical protein FGM27_06890 [Candidatus Omnitrophica bacterium]|nr:hypothetical protein [Candidatus Omnitrophota bacterium]
MKKILSSLKFLLTASALGLFLIPVWAGVAGSDTAKPAGFGSQAPLIAGLSAIEDSQAFQRYSVRKKSELSRLLYLMDRFRGSGYKVIYDGLEYDSETAAQESRKFIAKNYKQEPAVDWIRENAYRSSPGGNVIQVKTPDGTILDLRDVLIDELESLRRVELKVSLQS